jgi:hypothetical protein
MQNARRATEVIQRIIFVLFVMVIILLFIPKGTNYHPKEAMNCNNYFLLSLLNCSIHLYF